MEWSKEKTLKLINLLQVNASLWNPSLCDTRRDKQKRKEELRIISEILEISIPDTTKKIQHLRTQYNRESAREARANSDDPNDRYISNWYAYDYLHFMKDSSKHYRLLQCDDQSDGNLSGENKYTDLSPPHKLSRLDMPGVKTEVHYPKTLKTRDEFSVFGEYVANELRSLKGEKNLLVAKKKIQDAIFEVKMDLINEQRETACTVYTHATSSHSPKMYTTPVTAHIETMPSHSTPTSGISEIIINGACHYSNFKVDTQ